MKTRNIFAIILLALCTLAVAKNVVRIAFNNGTFKDIDIVNNDSITFTAGGDSIWFSSTGEAFPVDSIDSITFVWVEDADSIVEDVDSILEDNDSIVNDPIIDDDPMTDPVISDTIEIAWNGDETPLVKCTAPEVEIAIDGGNVTATNSGTATEYTYILSGTSANGSFTLVSDYKSTLILNGLSLQSSLEEALNIKCGKRVNLTLAEGSVNSLSDAKTDNGQKGAIYCKGHLEVSGGGELNLTGNVKHALSTKEYCLLKKTVGTINILAAVSDGIHAGQYFQMNGGVVNIKNVKGDGIQAEVTDDATDEDNGQLIIKGGTLSISTTADDVCGLQSDSLMTILGGNISITSSGAGSKSLKSDTDIRIEDGTLSVNNSGAIYNSETTSKGISTDGNLYIIGGDVRLSMSGQGGKGIKTDGSTYVGNELTGEGPMLAIKTTGGASQDSNTGGTSQPGRPGRPGGGGWGGPGGGESTGSSAKGIKCLGNFYQYGGYIFVSTTGSGAEGIESKQKTATSMNFCGGNTYIVTNDDCINSAGQINFTGANVMCYATNNDAIDSNYGKTGAVTITNGTVLAFSPKGGAEMGLDCDGMSYVKITGGTVVAGGGNQGGGSSSSLASGSTHYKVWSGSVSYTAGRYYSIVAGGKNIMTFRMPCTLTSSMNVYAGSDFKSNTTHYVYNSTTAPKTGEGILFQSSFDGAAEPLVWTGTDITSGTQTTTFSPN